MIYGHPGPGEAPGLARELLAEAQNLEEVIEDVVQDVLAIAQRISRATDRRKAALYAPALLTGRDVLDSFLEDLAAVADCVEALSAALGPSTDRDEPDAARARIALSAVRRIVETAGDQGREHAHIGRLATERVSDFAEFEMLYQQITRDLGRGDRAAVDARMPRFAEVERNLATERASAMLVDVRRRREELGVGGREDQGDDDTDFII
ncbi:hypothetical protein K3888_02035 [Dietzia aurantiaca]|uniref:hypothetical protein n=1 Tax=Dietzia aurantiaca TaxID=983873 RepID=UPI001E51A709|nr:hypothetical protein [Dietzia aurantiaca]MCD2261471.1 hypothetical protein [Dietzia aurantiaca]